MIMAKWSWLLPPLYGHCSNNEAEVRAILQGIFSRWQLQGCINQIWTCLHSVSFCLIHIFGEGNCIAYFMANVGVNNRIHVVFEADLSFPTQVRVSLKQEQDGIPNFRFRSKRTVFVDISVIWYNCEIVVFLMDSYLRSISPSHVIIDPPLLGLGFFCRGECYRTITIVYFVLEAKREHRRQEREAVLRSSTSAEV